MRTVHLKHSITITPAVLANCVPEPIAKRLLAAQSELVGVDIVKRA